MRHYVITGGAGFIGANITRKLLEDGHKVTILDNLISGDKNNLIELEKNTNFSFIDHDVIHPFSLNEEVYAVLHLASLASPKDYLLKPLETLLVGSIGTQNALDLARDKDARILLTSTSEIYGDPLVHPQKETYWGNVNPIGPRAPYDESKRYAETLTVTHHQIYGTKVRIVRIFNTYGPYMRATDGRVISNMLNQALLGKPLTIYGDGRQTRSFCYVDDLVEGLLKLVESDYTMPVNMGNPNEISMRELAETISRIFDVPLNVEYCELPKDDPTRRQPDITVAKNILGWEPSTTLEDGLKATHAYFRRLIG